MSTSEFDPASAWVCEAAVAADTADIVALVTGAYRGDRGRVGWTTESELLDGQRTDAAEIGALIDAPGNVILVLRGAQGLVGSVHLEQRADLVCYLGMLTVRPALQDAGVGRRLLAAAEEHARRHFGARCMEMTVIDLRTELIAWYERRGYARTGEVRPFPYGNRRNGLPRRDDLRFTVLRRAL
jgi:ribosomal protein S18 acetylase RimI-like enzyme